MLTLIFPIYTMENEEVILTPYNINDNVNAE